MLWYSVASHLSPPVDLVIPAEAGDLLGVLGDLVARGDFGEVAGDLGFCTGDLTEKKPPSNSFSVSLFSSSTTTLGMSFLGCSSSFFFTLTADISSSEATASDAFLLAAIRARRPELAADLVLDLAAGITSYQQVNHLLSNQEC